MTTSSMPVHAMRPSGKTWPRRFGALLVFLAALFGGGLASPASAAVTITSLTPNTGLTLGLGLVTVTGTDFVPLATTVTIGGTTVPAIVVTPGLLTFLTPAHVSGNVAVTVNTPFGTSAPATGGFTYANLPTLLSTCLLSGSVSGGTIVTLGGTNFIAGGTSVTIGGIVIPASSVTVISATSLSFVAPPHAPGVVPISVTTIAGISLELGNCFTYADAPTASSLLPHGGLTLGLTLVTVNGTDFIPGATSVNIGGNTVPAIVVTPNLLTFLTPPHAAGNVAVSVSTPSGTSAAVPGGFTYISLPTLLPNCLLGGSIAGGAVVTLNGTNFVAGETTVTIGGIVVAAVDVTVISPTLLTFIAPAHAAGTVAISVTTFAGVSLELLSCFTYADTPTIAAISPPGGPVSGGNTVTLSGTGFIPGLTTVDVDGQTIIPSTVLLTSLTFQAPAHAAGTVDVRVVTPVGTSNPAPGGYTYDARPAVSALSPASGPLTGTTGIVLTGAGFNPGNTIVNLDGLPIVPTAITATSLTFDAPAHAAGPVDVSVTTPGGTSQNVPGDFTYLDVPVAQALNPSIANVTGAVGVQLTGQNFAPGETIVNFDGAPITPTSVTATSLTFDAPAHAAGTVTVSVTTPSGTSNNVLGGFTYAETPTADALTPAAGPLTGTAAVQITGTGFIVGNTSVIFDGAPIVPTVLSTTQLTFDAPAHAAGTVAVSVSTPAGTSGAVPGGFTYGDAPALAGVTPSIVPTAGLTGVVLTGTGFIDGQTTVYVDGTPVVPVSVTPTSITFDAPPHAAGNVTINVETPLGTSPDLAGGLTYADAPVVATLNPQLVPITGATGLVLTGSDFIPGSTTVNVDGASITPTNVTPTSITFDVPAHAAATVDVSVTTPGGTSGNVPGGLTFSSAPSLVAATPSLSPLTGTPGVVLTGSGFIAGNTIVNLDGASIVPTSITPTSLTFDAPAHAAGLVALSVTTPVGTSPDLVGGFTYGDAPALAGVTPSIVPTAGLTGVVLTGTGFIDGQTTVYVDGTPVVPVSVTPTSITFDAPPHAAGNVTINVETPLGTSPDLAGGLTYADAPVVATLNPQLVPITGATGLVLTGSDFIPGSTTVNVDGASIVPTNVTPTSITFDVPAHAAATVDVSVTTPGGTSGNVPGGLTFSSAPSLVAATPSFSPLTGTPGVVLTGSGFIAGNTIVNLDGASIVPTSITPTSLTFDAPAHAAGLVALSVTTPVGTSPDLVGGFTYASGPAISAINPSSGPAGGGNAVVITGANFTGATAVTFGGTPATFAVDSAAQITATAPPGTGQVDVSVTGPGGSTTFVAGYTYLDAPVASSLSPQSGPTTGNTIVQVTGSNFVTGATDVAVDGVTLPASAVTVASSTSLTFTTPSHAPGTVTVAVTTAAGTTLVPSGFEYVGAPTVTALSPDNGPLEGISVTLTGTNFRALDTVVSISGEGGNVGLVTVNSSTSLTFFAPPHAAGDVIFVVTTSGGSANAPALFTYGTPALSVTAGDFTATGDQGGAGGWTTTSSTTAYVLANNGSVPVTWSVTLPSFLDTTPLSGTLNPGDSVTLTPVVNASASTLAPGTYPGTINVTSDGGDFSRNATLTVRDITPPVLVSGPANISVAATSGATTAPVTYAIPTFSDNVAVTSVVRTAGLASGADFPLGVTTVTHRASDAAGNVLDYSFTVTVTDPVPGADTQPPVITNLPADIVLTVTAPATTAVATWTPPGVTDNVPGATITQTAGPAPGSSFPIGTTTITYTATDAANLTTTASFTVTVDQIAEGTVSLVVESSTDGTFNFTSDTQDLTASITTSNGTGSFGPVSLAAGNYTLAFSVPDGVGVTFAACTTGTLDAASRSGTVNVTPGSTIVCTIRAEDSQSRTAATLGAFLQHRAALIVENAPDVARRLNRLKGGRTPGGVSGFGITMGEESLPFSVGVSADEMTFSTSLLRASQDSGQEGFTADRGRARMAGVAEPSVSQPFAVACDCSLQAPLDEIRPAAAAPGHVRSGQSQPADAGNDSDPMAHRFDIWVEGRYARFDAAGGEGTFGILHLGADYLVTRDILVGVGLQFDWLREHDPLGGETEGQGFMVGPYLTARVSEQLYVDLRAAWGTASNDVSPFGTYTDAVDSDRALVTAALIGEFEQGSMTIRPEARVTWYREETDAYVDALGVAIPALTVETGVLEFGPEVSWLVKLDDGASLRPSLKVQGIWTFAQSNTATLLTNAPGLADIGFRGRVELGLTYQRGMFSVGASTFYDGLGSSDFEALGGRFKLSLGF